VSICVFVVFYITYKFVFLHFYVLDFMAAMAYGHASTDSASRGFSTTAELPVTPSYTQQQKINGQSYERDGERQLFSCLATCFKHDASAAQVGDNKDVNIHNMKI